MSLSKLFAVCAVLVFATQIDALETFQVPASEWRALNTSVTGKLHHSTPFARTCFQKAGEGVLGAFNSDECGVIQNNYVNASFRLQNYGSNMLTQWETCLNQTCLLDKNFPMNSSAFAPPRECDQGSIPSYYIDVRQASDVITAFRFAKKNNVSLAVKNTGHDYQGRSAGIGRLGLWTHNLQGLALNQSFVPRGCPSTSQTSAVTMGAGSVFSDIYAFADSHNITIPGGSDPSVGAAGWSMGGGHSAISRAFGLGVDRLLEIEVVTPRGDHLWANACQNADLFFALRGGGGGSFGVVLSITTRALPVTRIQWIRAGFNGTSTDVQREFLQFMTDNALEFAKEGWGGYIVPTTRLTFNNPLITAEQANASALIQSFKRFIVSLPNGTIFQADEPSYASFFQRSILQEPSAKLISDGSPLTLASRLIPSDILSSTQSKTELINATLNAIASGLITELFQVTPIFFNGSTPGKTSVTPAWYNSIWHLVLAGAWNFDTSVDQINKIYTKMSGIIDPIRRMTPRSGAYLSESDLLEPEFESSFWGQNMVELKSIKLKYDPDQLLDCWHCVGFKSSSDSKYRCYPST